MQPRTMSRFISALLLLGALCGASLASAQTTLTRTSSFAYDPTSGLLTQEVVQPGDTQFELDTTYTYDAYGHKISTTISSPVTGTAAIASRTTSAAYDSLGEFATSKTNAVGQSESWQYDPRFGKPISHTGPNGLTTTWAYDSFGRKIQEIRPDLNQTQWTYQYCSGVAGGSATCPANGAYLVQGTPYAAGGTTQNGAITTVYYDSLDREIARDTQGFDGSDIRAATQYDSFGRVLQTSRPYFVTGGTPLWSVFAYDALSRPATETFPDGSVLSHAYHGLVTSDTNALSQTRTITKNSQGEVVAVTDPLGHTTTFLYDPFGNLIQATDPVGNIVTNTYDLRGRKTATSDPDLGAWSYTYDTLGELVSQTDAKSQTSTVAYDLLGRMTQRAEPDMTSNWTYDSAANGIGKLATAGFAPGTTSIPYQRVYAYDSLGRPSSVVTTIAGTPYTISNTYNASGQVASASYPSGFTVDYNYTGLGYATTITDAVTGAAYWTANTRDAELHLTQQTAGNQVVTNQYFDPNTGRLTGVQAGSGGAVENFSYTYDTIGNLTSRADSNDAVSESFAYDALNRVLSDTVTAQVSVPVKTFNYDAIGNLTLKSDVGTYTYPAPGSPRPHAVQGTSGGALALATTFTYDVEGNQTAGFGRTIGYTSFNKPNQIVQGANITVNFLHDTDHQRFEKQDLAAGTTTLYFTAGGIYAELVTGSGGLDQWNEYLIADGEMIGLRVNNVTTGTVSLLYYHKDHLGSIATLTDGTPGSPTFGTVVERDSFDAWGRRRNPNGSDDVTGSLASETTRGYTGQEELADVGLVHMNGRVYDPTLGRFTSADPVVGQPISTQGWNRYAYVGNNPLAFTDPNGFCFLGCFWKSPVFKAVVTVVIVAVAIYTAQPEIAEAAATWGTAAGVAASAAVGFGAGALAAGVTGGNVLQGALMAGLTAGAFYGASAWTQGWGDDFGGLAASAAVHGVAGGLVSVIGTGNFQSGFLAAGFTSFAGAVIPSGNLVENVITNSVIGGTGSVLGGGKFENGAITSAFQYAVGQINNGDASSDPTGGSPTGSNSGDTGASTSGAQNPTTTQLACAGDQDACGGEDGGGDQLALNFVERQFVPDSVASNAKAVLGAVTNNAFTTSQIDSIYNQVIRNIDLSDALKFGSINPSSNPIVLTPEQFGIVNTQIQHLTPDLQNQAQDQFGKALQNGRVSCPQCK